MTDADNARWAEHAAAEGAAVSADPGEGAAVPDVPDSEANPLDPVGGGPAPSNHLKGGGDPAEGGEASGGEFRAKEEPDVQAPAPSNHLTGGGDPAEGKR